MEESPYLKAHSNLRQRFEALPLIGSLNPRSQRLLLEASKIRRFAGFELITREGIFDPWVYILIQGNVLIEKGGQELAVLKQCGDLFGELCLIDKRGRSASARALTDTVCLAIDTQQLQDNDRGDQDALYAVIYRFFAKLLADRLRRTNEELIDARQQLQSQKKRR